MAAIQASVKIAALLHVLLSLWIIEINFNLKVNHAHLIKSLNEETTMADNTDSIVYNETDSNETLATNVSGREAASREGLATAYIFLFAMALFPIFIGSLRSVVHHYNLKVRERDLCHVSVMWFLDL